MPTIPTSPPQDQPSEPLREVDDGLEEAFWHRVADLEETYRRLWWSVDEATPQLGERFDRHRRACNERRTQALIDDIGDTVRAYPEAGVNRSPLRGSIKTSVREYATACLGWSSGERQLFFSDDAFRVTREFAREARRFDADVQMEALFQALRNVWIMNGLQILLGRPMELTPSVFAYSLLYPYTDNPLDGPDADGVTKKASNERLAKRLRGQQLEPVDAHERNVFQLVGMIEGQYPRNDFPSVYLSLLAIHRAQCSSLGQHGRQSPYETDILGISLAKGGSSVLADGYLVAGALSDTEAEFVFGYGTLLQLLDDLQDVGPDRQAQHMTIFSQTAEGWPLDGITTRLLGFMARILDSGAERFDHPRCQSLWMAMRRNCTHLLLQAVATNRGLYTSELVQALESYSPLPFSSLGTLKRRAERRHRKIKRAWAKQGVDLSVWEMLR